jgi:hypothetical protein
MSEPPPGHENATLAKQVREMIRLQDMNSMAGSLGKFIKGLGVCLGMGVVVASLITFCLNALFDTSLIGWSGWLLVFVVVLAPLLIWHERRSQADYLTDSVLAADPKPSSRGEQELNKTGFQIAAYASLLVWGPRALLDGIRAMRGRWTVTQLAVFDRAAVLVVDLAKFQGGVAIKELLHAPEDMQTFGSAVDLLDTHGWIGKSSDGRSLWLNSTFRQKLRQPKA